MMITSGNAVVFSVADSDRVHDSAGVQTTTFKVQDEIKPKSTTSIGGPTQVVELRTRQLRVSWDSHIRVDDVAEIWAVAAPVHAVLTLL
jgi:hypothetical protein